MTEQTYYDVWYTIEGSELTVMGNKVSVDVMDYSELGLEVSVAVNEEDIKSILNIEWGFKKTDKFISKFAAKLEKQIKSAN